MAVYGIDFYGVGRFGRDPAVVRPDFSVAPFKSMPLDYSTLYLSWVKPHSTDCTYLRLVRNAHNLSQTAGQNPGLTSDADAQADGMVLFTDVVDRPFNYIDSGLGSGFFYYTMWGWSNSSAAWIRCTDLIGLVPINWGYSWRLYHLLPAAYRDQDLVLVDPYNPWPVEGPNPPLQRYLSLLGFQLDFIRTELESLMSINDAQNCSGALLPLMAQQFAIPHEPEIGMQQERQLIANAVHLYKLKGSPRGITEFCGIMTSYPNTSLVHHGYNLLLTQDDGAMTDALGTWQIWPPTGTQFTAWTGGQAAGTALTWMSNLMTVTNMTNPVTEIYPGGITVSPPYNNTGMRIQATGAGNLVATTGPVPITDFVSSSYRAGTITWRFQIWSAVSRQVFASVMGDVGNGVVQTVVPEGTAVTESAGHWTQVTVTGPINPYPQTPPAATSPSGPASYYWLYPVIRIAGAAANEPHYVTLCGLWPCTPANIGVKTGASPYDYPRDVKVMLQPQYSNLLSNTLTTFTRNNPSPPPAQLLIGFDGLSAAANPKAPTGTPTGTMVIQQQTLEDTPGTVAVNGNSALSFGVTGPNANVWFGHVTSWSTAPPNPNGWFASPKPVTVPPAPNYSDGKTNDWFVGATSGASTARPWFDPSMTVVNSWFTMPEPNTSPPLGYFFGIGQDIVNGIWFPPPPQPTQYGNLGQFTVQSGQPFNFSVYARYQTAQDPSNAVMTMGFRWYYPDGTWVETSTNYTLTTTYTRYSIAPSMGPFSLGEPPPEANPPSGVLPTGVYPFVRFPSAQLATFLLNSAMLAPSLTEPPYMDATTYSTSTGEFIQDPTGASYYYARRTPRVARLTAELYRWLPLNSTYSIVYSSGATAPPLDPTLW